jgi:hypothetical protein
MIDIKQIKSDLDNNVIVCSVTIRALVEEVYAERTAQPSPAAVVPEGFVLVPKHATPEMLKAFFAEDYTQNGYVEMLSAAHSQQPAAAPAAPANFYDLVTLGLSSLKQDYSPECLKMASTESYVEDAVATLVRAGWRPTGDKAHELAPDYAGTKPPAPQQEINEALDRGDAEDAARYPAAPAQAQPVADPMDWPLPCDVMVGNGTHKKGVPLRSLVARMNVLHGMAKSQPVADAATYLLNSQEASYRLGRAAGRERRCVMGAPITIEEFRALAVQAGMGKFQLRAETMPREDMFIIGADFLDRLHAVLFHQKEILYEHPNMAGTSMP